MQHSFPRFLSNERYNIYGKYLKKMQFSELIANWGPKEKKILNMPTIVYPISHVNKSLNMVKYKDWRELFRTKYLLMIYVANCP